MRVIRLGGAHDALASGDEAHLCADVGGPVSSPCEVMGHPQQIEIGIAHRHTLRSGHVAHERLPQLGIVAVHHRVGRPDCARLTRVGRAKRPYALRDVLLDKWPRAWRAAHAEGGGALGKRVIH